MQLVVDVPLKVFFDVTCVSWFSIQDIAQLDSATCNHTRRPQLLENFSSALFDGMSRSAGNTYLKWLSIRQISVSDLVVSNLSFLPKTEADGFHLLSKINFNGVETLGFSDGLDPFNCYHFKHALIQNPTIFSSLLSLWIVDFTPGVGVLMKTLLPKCPIIEDVYSGYSEDMTDVHVEILTRLSPNLKNLKLMNCWGLTDKAIDSATDHCPKLTSIKLVGACKFTNESVFLIGWYYKSTLCVIDLSFCFKADRTSIAFLCSQCCLISDLCLNDCRELVGDALLRDIAESLPQLLALGIKGARRVTDDGIEVLTRKSTKLTYLNIDDIPSLTFKSVSFICANLADLKQCEFRQKNTAIMCHYMHYFMEHFDVVTNAHFLGRICGHRIAERVVRVQDFQTGVSVCKKFPLYEETNAHVNDHFYDLVVNSAVFKHVKSLSLYSTICESSLKVIARECQELEGIWFIDGPWREPDSGGYMMLGEDNTMTDAKFSAFVRNSCPSLTSISVSSCVRLTDASLLDIGDHAKNLELFTCDMRSFVYRKLSRISHVGLLYVLANCSMLSCMMVRHCRFVCVAYVQSELACGSYPSLYSCSINNKSVKM